MDVASSSLVTRSSPESFRGWSERAVALAKAGRPKPTSYRILPVYLWRKRAELHWVKAHEDLLQARAFGQLVIVRRPGRKRLELEIACRSRSDSSALLKEFGGRIEALPRNWLERFTRADSKANQDRETIDHFECGRDLSVPTVSAQRPPPHYHPSFVGIWNWRARHDGNVASFLGTTDPLLEPGLVARRSWDWQRNSCFGGKMFRCRPRHRYR